MTYVDHKIKVVYNGSELGKNYSAKGILNRVKLLKENQSLNEISENITKSGLQPGIHQTDGNTTPDKLNSHLLDTLLQPEYINNYIPNQLTPKRKKGRKGRSKKL